ncbi:MAG: serine hydrolase domain-containing protein [Hyphomicrobium sp.]|jgi:CubicO group peptidase (beta-lactamase class C family)
MLRHFRIAVLIAFPVVLPGRCLAGWGEAEQEKASALAAAFVNPQPTGEHEQTPGLSVAISRNGRILLAKGFGEALPSIPATAETIYQIGSLTKQFTAAAVLGLIEQKAPVRAGAPLALDTPVEAVLPTAAAWSLDDRPTITVRHLLTMTSNLPNFTRTPPESTDPWGTVLAPYLLDALSQVKPLGGPGSFEYSNTGYFLLAELIESPRLEIAPRSYRDALRELWTKAGLKDTGFHDDSALGKRLAGPTYKRRPAFLYGDWLKGSADVSSTVLDLQAWNKALIEGRVLSDAMVREMFSEAARVDVWSWYGMGWFVRRKDDVLYLTHSGSLPGYTSYNLIARKSTSEWSSVTILTNSYGVEGLDELAATLSEMALSD